MSRSPSACLAVRLVQLRVPTVRINNAAMHGGATVDLDPTGLLRRGGHATLPRLRRRGRSRLGGRLRTSRASRRARRVEPVDTATTGPQLGEVRTPSTVETGLANQLDRGRRRARFLRLAERPRPLVRLSSGRTFGAGVLLPPARRGAVSHTGSASRPWGRVPAAVPGTKQPVGRPLGAVPRPGSRVAFRVTADLRNRTAEIEE